MGRTVRIGGAHKTVICRWVRVSGTWRRVPYRHTRIGGVWKQTKIISDITSSGNYNGSAADPGPITINQTITVPAGNPGEIRINKSGAGTSEYKNGGGAWASLPAGDTDITMTTGAVLGIRTSGAIFDTATFAITDRTTNVSITTGFQQIT